MTTLDDRLVPVFARQHWLVGTDDIQTHGGSNDQAHHRVAIGRWVQDDVGVYRLAGMPKTWESRLLAPLLAIGAPAVASHFAAAVLHGIDGFSQGTPEITIPRGREHRRDGVLIHTSTDLIRCSPTVVDAIPVTDIDRTLLDIGRYLSDRGLLKAVESCRRAGSVSWESLISTLAHHARRGRPGIRRLRRVITGNMHRSEVTDSNFELLFVVLLVEAGLPEPVLHHKVFDGDRFVAEVDAAYPELKIAIELDGAVHLLPEVRERDLPRQNDLVLLGWTVLRFSWERFRDHPERVVAEIRAAISAARAALA